MGSNDAHNQTHELIREAVDHKIKLWDTLNEVEKQIGRTLNGLENGIDTLSTSYDSGDDVPEESIDSLLNGGEI